MKIKEAEEKKLELQRKITALIEKFERETGLVVKDIECAPHESLAQIGNYDPIKIYGTPRIKIEVNLR